MRPRHPQTGSHERPRRLIAALVVLCLAPLGLLTWFSLSLSATAVRSQVDARVQNTASASAVYVKEQLDGLAELVGSYAKRPSMVQAMRRPGTPGNRATIAFHLQELQQARGGIVVAAYGLDTIQRFVDDYAAAQGIRLTVTDQRGVVLAAPGAPRVELRRAMLAFGAVLGLALLVGLALLARALRDRTRAEQRVVDSEERTREILEATAEAFISIDAAGVVTNWNSKATETFGWTREEAVGRPLTELVIPEASRAAHDRGRQRFLETGEGPLLNWRVEVTAVHRDARQFPVELVIWPVGSGPETVFNAFAHDISERRQSEEAVRASNERLSLAKLEADRANQAKSEFLSKMSHELRTPLNAILGFGQLLQLDDLTPEQSESVDHMLRGGRHLLELINEVLDISRIESGNLSLSLEPVDLAEVVRDTVDLIRPLAAERELTIVAPTPDDPTLAVQADRQRLKQVLLNLASNAVKYNRHAGTIRVAYQPTPDGRVRIAVQDTGPGLSADKLARLFSPFDRLGAEETEVEGTGMGLALSKGLVEAMGGDLTADSVEGRGTTFTVELAELAEVPSRS